MQLKYCPHTAWNNNKPFPPWKSRELESKIENTLGYIDIGYYEIKISTQMTLD